MVKIRMTRFGRHKLPFYRIVIMDSRTKRDGDYIDLVGTYEPFKGELKINEELVIKYLNLGAQPSDTVRSFLKDKGIWKKFVDQKLLNKKQNTKKPKNKRVVKKTDKVKKTTTVKTQPKKVKVKPKVEEK